MKKQLFIALTITMAALCLASIASEGPFTTEGTGLPTCRPLPCPTGMTTKRDAQGNCTCVRLCNPDALSAAESCPEGESPAIEKDGTCICIVRHLSRK